jgi:hypothetical protein
MSGSHVTRRWREADSNRRSHHTAKSFPTAPSPIDSKIAASGRKTPPALFLCCNRNAGRPSELAITVPTGILAARCGSTPGRDARLGLAAVLLFAAALSPPAAVAQPTPQPVFTELFAYDLTAPTQLLGKWLISSQLDSKLQPLPVGVVEDGIGKTVGRVTVQEGDGLDGASEGMLQARHYICNSEGCARRRWRLSLAAWCQASGRRSK